MESDRVVTVTVPNLLTFLRLALTPVVAVFAYSTTTSVRMWALGLFLFAMLTDAIDGWIARLPGQRSRLGLYLDPVADKTLVLTLLFVLADIGLIPLWMALLMMAREQIVGGLRSAAATTGNVVGANWMGKTKGFLQTVCIGVGLGTLAFGVERSVAERVVTALTGFMLLLAWIFAAVFVWWNRLLLREAS